MVYLGFKWAKMLMRIAGERRLGFRRAVDILDMLGLKYRWKDMLWDYRQGLRSAEAISRLIFCPRKFRPSWRMISPPDRWMNKRFRYTIRFEILDKRTGKLETAYMRLISDRLRTRGRVEDEAYKRLSRAFERYDKIVVKHYLNKVEYRGW